MTDASHAKHELRRALSAFVTGVTIVTARDEHGQPVGLTANSFNSVSLEPPLVLWSLALNSPNLQAFRQASAWAVHVLSAAQEELSARFASRGIDKFAGVNFHSEADGVPLLDDCAARFTCRATFEYEGGDHAIFVGEVIDVALTQSPPLIFHGGRYNRVMPSSDRIVQPPMTNDGEFGRYFTGHLLGRAHHTAFEDVRREYRRRGLRSSEYTVVASLGLGDGCTAQELRERASRGGVDLPQTPIDRLIEKGEIELRGDHLNLTKSGKRLLTELVAVAQSTQLRLDARLSTQEMALLHDFLDRISGVKQMAMTDG